MPIQANVITPANASESGSTLGCEKTEGSSPGRRRPTNAPAFVAARRFNDWAVEVCKAVVAYAGM